jgi:hypothetical protein
MFVALALAALAVACGSPTQPCSNCGGGSGIPPPPDMGPWVLAGAGDIGWCQLPGKEATGKLLQALPSNATIFTAGDNAYPHGEKGDFDQCYAPYWGPFRSRTLPSPGNHEYENAGAAAYFDYFGANAGPDRRGYYSYSFGQSWLLLSLNSEVDARQGSAQLQWVASELAAKPFPCTIAIWHRPLFSSGPNPKALEMRDLWRTLYDAGVDIIINGHDHLYERFSPQDPNGRSDPAKGIRQFIVGTGGAAPYSRATNEPNSEFFLSGQDATPRFGILKLTLNPTGYQWEYIPTAGTSDSGAGACH